MRKARCLLALTMACGPVGSGKSPSQAKTAPSSSASVTEGTSQPTRTLAASPIVAQLVLTREQVDRDSDVEVAVHIENRSGDRIILLAEELKLPSVLFEVRDATGQRLPPTSPPVPTGEKHVVEPGKSIDIKMSLAGMFSPPLKPGEYSVRLRRIDTTPRRFRILAH